MDASPSQGSPHNLYIHLTVQAFLCPSILPLFSPHLPLSLSHSLSGQVQAPTLRPASAWDSGVFLLGSPSPHAPAGGTAPGLQACLLPGAAAQGRALPTTYLAALPPSPVTSRDAWALGLCFGVSSQSLCIVAHCTFFVRAHVEGVARSTWHWPGMGGGVCWLLSG